MSKLIKQVNHHPWNEEDTSFVTQIWETESHESSEQFAGMMEAEGWMIYLISNREVPLIVVYRSVFSQDDQYNDDCCYMCQGSGTLTDDDSEVDCTYCDGSGFA